MPALSTARPPSPRVLEHFGLAGEPVALTGEAYRVGDVVVKQALHADEAEWIQSLASRIEPDGFAIAQPVATVHGGWVHDGWSASRFVEGLRPAAPAWPEIAAAGLRFTAAADRARPPGSAALAARTHPWAAADRVAWGESAADPAARGFDLVRALGALLGPVDGSRHVVHGDLSGNVHFDPSGRPVILDISPYLRPRRWGPAIVIADAVLWGGGPLHLATSFASTAADRDLLGRALIFRLVAEDAVDPRRSDARLEPYRRAVAALT